MKLKLKALLAIMVITASMAYAQNDPVLLTIGGHKIARSEFEYAYKKATRPGMAGKFSKDDFLDQYIEYQLKVQAARDAHLDETEEYKGLVVQFTALLSGSMPEENITTTPMVVTSSSNIEADARRAYAKMQQEVNINGGLVRCGQILIRLNQHASYQEEQRVRDLAYSLYDQLRNGANFEELAKKYSDDEATKANGGMFPLVMRGQTLEEVENKIFSMQPGEISEPVLSPFGYHIIKVIGREQYPAFAKVKRQIEHRLVVENLRNQIIGQRLGSYYGGSASATTTYIPQTQQPNRQDGTLGGDDRLVLQELKDGLLVDAISKKMFPASVVNDEEALRRYFDKHEKEYKGATKALVGKKGKLLKPKQMSDVKPLVEADLRTSLEDYWVKDLKKKYKVVVDKKVLSAIR